MCHRTICPRHQEYGYGRKVLELRIRLVGQILEIPPDNQGIGEIRTPGCSVPGWCVEHEVRAIVAVVIGKIGRIRHHVGHGTRLKSGQFFPLECRLDRGDDLDFGMDGQDSFGAFVGIRKASGAVRRPRVVSAS